jgi:acyl-CoA dehydrogenase
MNLHAKAKSLRPARKSLRPESVSPVAPDCAGQDFYAVDLGLQQLLALYLPPEVHQRLHPHFRRLGIVAGGRLDELARIADKNPPALNRAIAMGRTRTGSNTTPPTVRWSR